MDFAATAAVERIRQLAFERAIGVKPGHFVLILVRHELVIVARHRDGELAFLAAQLPFCSIGDGNQPVVARGIGVILIPDQAAPALGDQCVGR